MSILKEHLANVLNKDIVVVMTDGQAFKGILTAFDDECIKLTDVMESRASDARWREALVTVPSREASQFGMSSGIMLGDTGSSMLKLTTVIIRIAHISRLWLWTPEKPEGY